ncbi:hypothetical protein ACFQ9X_02990 [Catenulispora yoronensis]
MGLAFQAVGIVFRNALHGRGISPHYDIWWATDQYFQTVLGQGLYTEQLNERLGFIMPAGDAHYLAWAAAGVVLVLAVVRVTRPNWPVVVMGVLHSVLLFDGLAMQGGSDAPRYEMPAICLLLAAVGGALTSGEGLRAGVERESTRGSSSVVWSAVWSRVWSTVWSVLRAVPGVVALGFVVGCIFGGYTQPTNVDWRSKGPSFDAQLSQAAAVCADKARSDVQIAMAPSFASWTMTVPCDLVRNRDDFFQLSP